MKDWYYAVCEECGEARCIYVNNPIVTFHYLEGESNTIQKWMSKHWGHELRLICTDPQMDKLYESGYEKAPPSHHSNYKTRIQEDAENDQLLIRKKKVDNPEIK